MWSGESWRSRPAACRSSPDTARTTKEPTDATGAPTASAMVIDASPLPVETMRTRTDGAPSAVERHAAPGEREAQQVADGLVLGEVHGVQRRVEQRGVQPEGGRLRPALLGQRDLGEDLVAPPPDGTQRPGRWGRSRSPARPGARTDPFMSTGRAPAGGHAAADGSTVAAAVARAARTPVACRIHGASSGSSSGRE